MLNDKRAVNKRIDLQCLVYEEKPHVVLVTESWGNESVSSELTLDGYRPERFDRKDGRKGGGVLMHIMDGIDYKREYKLEKMTWKHFGVKLVILSLVFVIIHHQTQKRR